MNTVQNFIDDSVNLLQKLRLVQKTNELIETVEIMSIVDDKGSSIHERHYFETIDRIFVLVYDSCVSIVGDKLEREYLVLDKS